jgi:arabinogalactan oligomer / maltooligosaccharide transport system permease protein
MEGNINAIYESEKKSAKIKYKRKLSKRERIELWIKRIFLIAAVIVVIFPVFAIISASLSTGTSFMQKNIVPDSITFKNYAKALSENVGFVKWMRNTTFVAIVVALFQLVLTLPSAFAFSKFKFKGRNKLLIVLLILQMFPASMTVPAILSVAYKIPFGMDNLLFLSLILCAGSAYNIWLMKGFMDGIPTELEEAARIDGATTWQTFIKIILPLSKSMAVVIFFFAFIAVYGEFVFSSALIKDKDLTTLVVGLKSFTNGGSLTDWPMYSACSIMVSVPLAIIFVVIQKFISEGLVAGSVKE